MSNTDRQLIEELSKTGKLIGHGDVGGYHVATSVESIDGAYRWTVRCKSRTVAQGTAESIKLANHIATLAHISVEIEY